MQREFSKCWVTHLVLRAQERAGGNANGPLQPVSPMGVLETALSLRFLCSQSHETQDAEIRETGKTNVPGFSRRHHQWMTAHVLRGRTPLDQHHCMPACGRCDVSPGQGAMVSS